MNKSRATILIVDDVEINRTILAEIFKDDYNILEADNGLQAIEMINGSFGISAVLLDLIMPGINGLEVLKEMNKSGKTDSIPVFLITAAESQKALMDGYQLGAVDVIMKPFMPNFIKCRINNVIELYAHRNKLEHIVAKQVERLNSLNQSMVETLATVIEFRDCESGEHVKRIGRLTKILMTQVSEMYPEHHLPETEIDKIVTSSILHDVGKISIPVRFCRFPHERWDGRGYPDGLSGDDISIWAQVVSVADVYDALTAERVYKKAFSHEKAVQMIHDGECGTFSPKLLKAFDEVLDDIVVKE